MLMSDKTPTEADAGKSSAARYDAGSGETKLLMD
jgi:hypothetical protein